MDSVMEFIKGADWGYYFNVFSGVVAAASVAAIAVSKLTKNTVDDRWAARLVKFHEILSKLALNSKVPDAEAPKEEE